MREKMNHLKLCKFETDKTNSKMTNDFARKWWKKSANEWVNRRLKDLMGKWWRGLRLPEKRRRMALIQEWMVFYPHETRDGRKQWDRLWWWYQRADLQEIEAGEKEPYFCKPKSRRPFYPSRVNFLTWTLGYFAFGLLPLGTLEVARRLSMEKADLLMLDSPCEVPDEEGVSSDAEVLSQLRRKTSFFLHFALRFWNQT